MAKTRIKTTPMRWQKDALMVTSTNSKDWVNKHKLFQKDTPFAKVLHNAPSTINNTTPKRTNSISSATSTQSVISDNQSTHSDNDSPTPAPEFKTAAVVERPSLIKIINAKQNDNNVDPPTSLLCKPTPNSKRKFFLITERNEEVSDGEEKSLQQNNKRKMFLIMEENNEESKNGNNSFSKNNLKVDNKRRKLTLFADKSDVDIPQKFETILPEILNRIQHKHGNNDVCVNKSSQQHKQENSNGIQDTETKLPITLPPKKNRTKIISAHDNETQDEKISAATPVIVSSVSLFQNNINSNDDQTMINTKKTASVQKHINLSTDFLFLMKILPKLESIPEPEKLHVRNYIESYITANASKFEQQ